MKKNGISIRASIMLGIGCIVFIVLEWIGIAFLSAYFAIGAFKDFYDKNNDSFENSNDKYEDYETYENNNLGIKFKYPKKFASAETDNNNGYTTITFVDKNTGESVNLVSGKVSGVKSFEEYISLSIQSLKSTYSLSDEQIEIEKDGVKMGGREGFKDYYSYLDVNVYQCATLVDDDEYVLTYSGKDEEFKKSTGNTIFESFEFIENRSDKKKNDNKDKGNTKENAAEVGQWCKASKYLPATGKYEDVKVKVNNIIRGEEAKKAVEAYAAENSGFKYENVNDTSEWAIIEYTVNMENISIPDYGIAPSLSVYIVGDGTYDSIEYNNKNYNAYAYPMSVDSYVKEKEVTNKVATIIPVGCENYLIEFGNYNETTSYVKGK